MNRHLVKLVGSILLAGAAMLVALPACGGAAGGTTAVPATPQATATARPTVAPAPTSTATAAPSPTLSPALTPTANPVLSTTPPAVSIPATSSPLLAQGGLVFEKTAGGVGCAFCHGLDGKGGGVAGLGAPDIRGAAEAKVRGALIGGVPLMSFIKLSDEEITAVVAYLKYLDEQP